MEFGREALSGEHHAFTYHRDVLTIPAYRYTYTEDEDGYYDYDYFSGALSFGIDSDTGITMLGEVDHRPLVEESHCLYSLAIMTTMMMMSVVIGHGMPMYVGMSTLKTTYSASQIMGFDHRFERPYCIDQRCPLLSRLLII